MLWQIPDSSTNHLTFRSTVIIEYCTKKVQVSKRYRAYGVTTASTLIAIGNANAHGAVKSKCIFTVHDRSWTNRIRLGYTFAETA